MKTFTIVQRLMTKKHYNIEGRKLGGSKINRDFSLRIQVNQLKKMFSLIFSFNIVKIECK